MTDPLVIILPYPPKALWPNARPHHMEKHRHRKKYRIDAGLAAFAALNGQKPPQWNFALEQSTFYCKTKNFPDGDNATAALKSGYDGLQDAQIVPNDRNVIHLPPRFEHDKQHPRVEIAIRELTIQQFDDALRGKA